MQTYNYKALDKTGKSVKGSLTVDSQEAVLQKLKEIGCFPISIEEEKGAVRKGKSAGLFGKFQKVKLSDLRMFTQQMAVLQKAGVSLVHSLKSLKEQIESPALSAAVSQIAQDIEGGESISAAMAKHPRIFDNLYVSLIRAGETGGVLTDSLERLAKLEEADEKMNIRIKSAMRYPVMVTVALIVGVVLLVMLVVPAFSKIYSSMNVKLPLPTQILLGTHFVITKRWWLILGIGGIIYFAFKKLVSTAKGREIWDNFTLKVIIFGPLTLKMALSRFARTTAILMRSGVPILDVLSLAANTAGNVVIAKVVNQIREDVNRGLGMAEPMRASKMFPTIVVQMVSVGEETGKTDELLVHVADYYDSQVDYTIDNLTSMIEPILLLFMGGAVLLVMLGVFMPMWNMAQLMKQ